MTTVNKHLHQHNLLSRVELGIGKLNLDRYTADRISNELHKWVIRINHRAKARAGQASSKKKTIELTGLFFEAAGREADHTQTLLHEVAHLVSYFAYPKCSPHGREWKRIMIAFGANTNRCCNYSYLKEAKAQTAKHQYECMDCGYIYTSKRALVRIDTRLHGPCRRKPNGGHLTHTVLR